MAVLGKTFSYTYDEYGNRLTRSVLNHNTNVTVTNTYTYDTYGRLSEVDGEYFTYDTLGKITGYGYNSYIWTKTKLLSRFTDGMFNIIDFEYNAEGLRTSKKNNYTYQEYKYILDGDKIVRELQYAYNQLQATVDYYYDQTGICGFCIGGKEKEQKITK